MMNILMSANQDVMSGVELVLYTLLTHNKNCRIYIATMDIDVRINDNGGMIHYNGLHEGEKSFLKKMVKYLDQTSEIKFIDCHDYYMNELYGNPNELSASWLTPYTSLRLFADEMLPNIDHVLYLDCDVSVHANLEHMYYDCISKDVDYSAHVSDDACGGKGEMVAGVMVLNLKKNRETGFLKLARENVKRNAYQWYDQDAIRDTGVVPNKLSSDYAYMDDVFTLTSLPKILHYINRLSPNIYQKDSTQEYFYRKFSFLKDAKEGIEFIKKLNFKGD